jgi:hypothetical protein
MGVDVNIIDVVVGAAVLPPVIAMINQARWSGQLKGLIALLACCGSALVATLIRGPVSLHDWRNTAVVTAGTAFAAYKVWWQPTGIAPAIEAATSAGPAQVLDVASTTPTAVPSDGGADG